MKANNEYKKELNAHQAALRRSFPPKGQLREMIASEAERMGLTMEQLFHPNTFARALHLKRSALLEAIALITEERTAMRKMQSSKSS